MNRRKILQQLGLGAGIGLLPFGIKANTTNLKEIPQPPAPPTGAQDRAYWCELLHKIASPVILNMGKGTLSRNMALEKAPRYSLKAEKVSYFEAVGRTLSGVAPWLSLPPDNTAEGRMRAALTEALLQGLTHAVDPAHPDFLNFETEHQPIVDAAFVAHGFLRAYDALWQPLSAETKKGWIKGFQQLRTRKASYSNWLLFSGITEAFILKAGEQHDPARIDYAIRKTQEWYVGDGWYSDGPKFCMDYYNSYVIHPMLVDTLAIAAPARLATATEYETAVKRMVRYGEFLERMVAPDGSFPAFGRSITYRTACFQALAQVALMDKLPAHLPPAQVRCALTAVMHRMYDGVGNFDAKGWLQLGFAGHQPNVADTYTSTGSLYMATMGFLPLGLPATHSFWADPPTDWTQKKAWSGQPFVKDYKVDY